MKKKIKFFLLLALIASQLFLYSQYKPVLVNDEVVLLKKMESKETIDAMISLLRGDKLVNKRVLEKLDATWDDGYLPILVDIIYFSDRQVDRRPIVKLIEKKTGKKFGLSVFKWLEWIWSNEPKTLPYQGDWMAAIYKNIDPKFERYFKGRTETSLIRLDEVRWGGVRQDGIPPLRGPKPVGG